MMSKNMRKAFDIMKSNIEQLAARGEEVDDIIVDPNVITAKWIMLDVLKNHPEDPRCERFSSILRIHPQVEYFESLIAHADYLKPIDERSVDCDEMVAVAYTVEEYLNKSDKYATASIEDNKAILQEARKALSIIDKGVGEYHLPFPEIIGVILRGNIVGMIRAGESLSIRRDEMDEEEGYGLWLLDVGAYDFVHGF